MLFHTDISYDFKNQFWLWNSTNSPVQGLDSKLRFSDGDFPTKIQLKTCEWDNKNEFDAFFPYMQDAVFVSIHTDIVRYHIFVRKYNLSFAHIFKLNFKGITKMHPTKILQRKCSVSAGLFQMRNRPKPPTCQINLSSSSSKLRYFRWNKPDRNHSTNKKTCFHCCNRDAYWIHFKISILFEVKWLDITREFSIN